MPAYVSIRRAEASSSTITVRASEADAAEYWSCEFKPVVDLGGDLTASPTVGRSVSADVAMRGDRTKVRRA